MTVAVHEVLGLEPSFKEKTMRFDTSPPTTSASRSFQNKKYNSVSNLPIASTKINTKGAGRSPGTGSSFRS
jgi:hypothetical protein